MVKGGGTLSSSLRLEISTRAILKTLTEHRIYLFFILIIYPFGIPLLSVSFPPTSSSGNTNIATLKDADLIWRRRWMVLLGGDLFVENATVESMSWYRERAKSLKSRREDGMSLEEGDEEEKAIGDIYVSLDDFSRPGKWTEATKAGLDKDLSFPALSFAKSSTDRLTISLLSHWSSTSDQILFYYTLKPHMDDMGISSRDGCLSALALACTINQSTMNDWSFKLKNLTFFALIIELWLSNHYARHFSLAIITLSSLVVFPCMCVRRIQILIFPYVLDDKKKVATMLRLLALESDKVEDRMKTM